MALPEPFYLPLRRGRRFCVRYSANGPARGSLLFVHAFAEEMNKSRRMVALQARALADRGFGVLLVDLHGCGDSDGDFGDADWAGWRDDVVDAALWWRAQSGHAPILWSMRAGCLLACDAAGAMGAEQFLFWQPQPTGAQALQQFLRLRVAGELIGRAGTDRTGTAELRAKLESGATLDIAGYALVPGVAMGLDAADLAPLPARVRVAWLEVSSAEPPELSPAARMRVSAWQAAGSDVRPVAVAGLPFWQTQEIAECPALIEATTSAVLRWCA